MIDVLLVLLIIFMVIVPVTPKGLDDWCPSRPRIRKSTAERSHDCVQVIHVPGGRRNTRSMRLGEQKRPSGKVD